jgi:prepilin-type N-terminal cleavage/methylation domain-containing protein
MKTNQKNNSGFTLVELAIVIVIIGLLVGGVLQGQELIKQAQIRSAMSSIQGYNAAINTFRAKYNEMPGDISRAGTFGVDRPKGGSVNVDITYTSGTSNGDGNGNGTLESATAATTLTGMTIINAEIANFWTHLGNAQLVKGNYPWVATTATAGTTFPSMPVGTGIVAVSAGGLTYWVIGTANTLTRASGITSTVLGGTVPGTGSNGTLSPSEAFGIDGKLDDGSPATGAAVVISAGSGSSGAVAATGLTVLTLTGTGSCLASATTYNIAGTQADVKSCLLAVRADG